jgi:biopolymer transport protein ExbD
MAMSVGRPRKGAIAEINVTPMADVMIVLLIIFMVTAPILARPPVRLPGATHASEHDPERLEIVVRSTGELAVAGTPIVGTEDLTDYVAARASLSREPLLVMVEADGDVEYTAVGRVLAACRRAGVERVALAAEPRLEAGGFRR